MPPSGAPELEPAGFVSRLLAFAVDTVLLGLATGWASWFVATLEALLAPWERLELTAVVLAVVPLIAGVYFAGFWVATGQTVGKWLLGLRVVTEGGDAVSLPRALARLAGYLLSGALLFAGFLWILLDRNRRGLHDRIAGTRVIYTSPKVDGPSGSS